MGPWLANNIRECDGLVTMMSYWTFSDVFEGQGVVKTPFYGGYGLLAERHLPKAAFWAFDLLHNLGEQRELVDSDDALVTKRADGTLVMALWNYAEPDTPSQSKTFHLKANRLAAKAYRMQVVSPDHASVLENWKQMGSPVSPTPEQAQQLIRASRLPEAQKFSLDQPLVLAPQTLAVLEIEP
jgi:xylan 1,4-beta-xylosidase